MTFVWFEYVSRDADSARGFFGELFQWGTQAVPMPEGAYTMITSGERTIGGYAEAPANAPAHWLPYLGVKDARRAAAQVTALGGKVVQPPVAVGPFGTMAVAADPQGGAFALWQPTSDESLPEPTVGTFTWNELASKDPDASVAFYSGLAGYTDKPMEMPGMGTYHVLEQGGVPRAGIMAQQMPGQPHAWLPYVQVASADATADKAKRLGATLLVPPTDIPGVGRFAIFVDPRGAALGVLEPPRA
jgi:uncharacterized protein